MGATYIDLTNQLLRRFREVELTTSNFSNTDLEGPQAAGKDFINDAIACIYDYELEWPFNHATATQVLLTDGTQKYSVPADLAHLDNDSAFLNRDVGLDFEGWYLRYQKYYYWLSRVKQHDEYMDSTEYRPPERFFVYPDGDIGISPPADKAYTLTYDYWKAFTLLSAHSDTTDIPVRYNHLILDKASENMFLYREDPAQASIKRQSFTRGIKKMQNELIPKDEYMTVRTPMSSHKYFISVN